MYHEHFLDCFFVNNEVIFNSDFVYDTLCALYSSILELLISRLPVMVRVWVHDYSTSMIGF